MRRERPLPRRLPRKKFISSNDENSRHNWARTAVSSSTETEWALGKAQKATRCDRAQRSAAIFR